MTTNLAAMRPNAPITVGLVYSDTWRPMKTTVESHRDIAYAVEFLVTNVFHATGVVAARLGRAVSSFKTFKGATASKLLWQNRSSDDLSSADFERASGYHTKDVVGHD